jgi:Tol biopolymer transport system component
MRHSSLLRQINRVSAAVWLTACSRANTEGEAMAAPQPAAGDEPQMFAPGEISTGAMELNSAFTRDGKTIYFTKRTPKGQLWVMLSSRLDSRGHWRTPEVLPFSGQYSDFDPFLSPDGSELYWSSARPVDGQPRRDFDIWRVRRNGDTWGPPEHLGPSVNTTSQEYYPSISADGTLFFSSNRAGGLGNLDVYQARKQGNDFATPENLGPSVNSERYDGDPYISADGNVLIFVGNDRPEGLGGSDLYISRRSGGGWTPARNLGPRINSPVTDFCPIGSPDGQRLFFTSDRGFADQPLTRRLTYAEFERAISSPRNGFGDIYSIPIAALPR